MIHRQKRDAFSIELTAKLHGFYRRQRMGDHRHLQTMFGTFSVRTLRISGQRLINFMREDGRKKWLAIDYLLFSLRQTSLCGEGDEDTFRLQ